MKFNELQTLALRKLQVKNLTPKLKNLTPKSYKSYPKSTSFVHRAKFEGRQVCMSVFDLGLYF